MSTWSQPPSQLDRTQAAPRSPDVSSHNGRPGSGSCVRLTTQERVWVAGKMPGVGRTTILLLLLLSTISAIQSPTAAGSPTVPMALPFSLYRQRRVGESGTRQRGRLVRWKRRIPEIGTRKHQPIHPTLLLVEKQVLLLGVGTPLSLGNAVRVPPRPSRNVKLYGADMLIVDLAWSNSRLTPGLLAITTPAAGVLLLLNIDSLTLLKSKWMQTFVCWDSEHVYFTSDPQIVSLLNSGSSACSAHLGSFRNWDAADTFARFLSGPKACNGTALKSTTTFKDTRCMCQLLPKCSQITLSAKWCVHQRINHRDYHRHPSAEPWYGLGWEPHHPYKTQPSHCRHHQRVLERAYIDDWQVRWWAGSLCYPSYICKQQLLRAHPIICSLWKCSTWNFRNNATGLV